MTDTPMKDRLARVLWAQWHSESEIEDSLREEVWQQDKDDFLLMVDAILREMLEPSEGMQKAGITALCKHDNVAPAMPFTAMIRYIIDEGLPTHEDVLGILNESQD